MKRRVRKSRYGIKRRPRVIRLQDVLRLNENELHMDESVGTVIETYSPRMDERITLGDLLDKFYHLHIIEESDYWKARREEIVPGRMVTPAAFKLIKNQNSALSEEKYWIAIFYGGFHVCINAHGKKSFGPHQAQLWFRSHTTNQFHWIATLQLCVAFYSEKSMKEALMTACEAKEWFISTHDRKAVIIP